MTDTFSQFLINHALETGMDQYVRTELAKGHTTAAEIADALGGGPYTPELVQASLDRIGRP